MRHFKLPLIVTGIALVGATIVGLVIVTAVHRASISSAEKERRVSKAGLVVGVVSLMVISPFWFVAAVRAGRERRQARDNAANLPPPA